MLTSIAAIAAFTILPVQGFQVHLYRGTNCAGEPLGTYPISLANNRCETAGAGEAQGALIVPEDSDGQYDSVAFWKSASCDESLQAEADTGCITVSSSFDTYSSFNVISGAPQQPPKEREVFQRSNSMEANKDVPNCGLTPDEFRVFGTADPEWLLAEDNEVISHGAEEMFEGVPHKWHEEALGIYKAVPSHMWDDEVHTRNKTPLVWSYNFPIDFSENRLLTIEDLDALQDRDLQGLCEAYRNCADTVRQNAQGFYMNKVVPALINGYVAAHGGGQDIWNYLREENRAIKFVAQTAVGYVTSIGASYTFNKLTSSNQHSQVAKCSTQGTEAGTLQAMVQSTVTVTETVTSVETILGTQDGHNRYCSWQITSGQCMTCYPGSCGAPTTKKKRAFELEMSPSRLFEGIAF